MKKSTGEIVFCVRRNYLTSPGGDSVQIQTWVSVFQRMNFEIKILREPVTDRDFHHAALVFVWHLERLHESYQPWETARKKNIPVILVPTFWYNGKRGILYPVVRQCELWIRYILFRKSSTCPLTHLWSNCRKNLLTKSNLLLANSFAEKQLLIREGANPEKISVIPNVIQLTDFSFSEKIPWERRTRIVCVGHFCPRKNQLALIRALKETDISITFIGSARPMHQRYLRRCKTEAGSRHIFLENMNHRDTIKMLMESRVSISVSQQETPGISNLEAAAAGCSLILPDSAPVKEYFSGYPVKYINPEKIDPHLIRDTVNQPPPPDLAEHIIRAFSERILPEYMDRIIIKPFLSN